MTEPGPRRPWWRRRRAWAFAALWLLVAYPFSFVPACWAMLRISPQKHPAAWGMIQKAHDGSPVLG